MKLEVHIATLPSPLDHFTTSTPSASWENFTLDMAGKRAPRGNPLSLAGVTSINLCWTCSPLPCLHLIVAVWPSRLTASLYLMLHCSRSRPHACRAIELACPCFNNSIEEQVQVPLEWNVDLDLLFSVHVLAIMHLGLHAYACSCTLLLIPF